MDQDPRGGPLQTLEEFGGASGTLVPLALHPMSNLSGIPQAHPRNWVGLLEENFLLGARRGPLWNWAGLCEVRSQQDPAWSVILLSHSTGPCRSRAALQRDRCDRPPVAVTAWPLLYEAERWRTKCRPSGFCCSFQNTEHWTELFLMKPQWLPTAQGQVHTLPWPVRIYAPCPALSLAAPYSRHCGQANSLSFLYQATSPHHWAPAGMSPRPGCTLE